MSYPSTGRTFRERFGAALAEIASRCRYQQKHLARMTGANVKTVANWLSGANAPSGEHLVHLIREEDEVLFTVLAMADRLPENLTAEQRLALLQAFRLLQEKS